MSVVLKVISGPHQDTEYVFDRHQTFIVGRSTEAHFSVPEDKWLSRHHFFIEFNPPLCLLKDSGSTNGTRVNGQKVEQIRLRDGDVISAGKSTFVIRVDGSRELQPAIRCMACQAPPPDDVAVAAEADDDTITWTCERCAAQALRFPTPPPGYWIESRIGGGGMGEVFKARHLKTQRIVAMKMMIPTSAVGERAKSYFDREMKVLEQLKHPNIVECYEVYKNFGQYILVMEYVDGPNAREWLGDMGGQAPVALVASIGVQLLAALDHAHGKGFVHRDIKPSNLLIERDVEPLVVKLSDFGLAKNFRDDAGFTGLTHQGDIGGSVGFLSPDHIRDFREVKEPADIYSAGATLYYLLTGQYPFLDFDPTQTNAYVMILEHPTVPLRVHRPDAPEALERVLRKSLEKHPRDRWKSAASMAEALRPFL